MKELNTHPEQEFPVAVRRPQLNAALLRQIPHRLAKQAALLSLSLLILFPLYFMFNNSLKQRTEFLGNQLALPENPTLKNFISVLQHPHLLGWFGNSVFLTFVSVSICTLVAILAAYAFANMSFRGRDMLFSLITPLMVIPPIVMVIPLFVLFRQWDLVNNLWGPILIYSGLMLPFTIFLLRNFFVTIPHEIQEAARMDGANDFQLLTQIDLPLLRPAIITSMIVNAVWVWNELLIALVFLQTEELRTLIVGISVSLQKRFTLDVPALMAGLAVATLPMILLYIIGQRALVRGLVSGFEK